MLCVFLYGFNWCYTWEEMSQQLNGDCWFKPLNWICWYGNVAILLDLILKKKQKGQGKKSFIAENIHRQLSKAFKMLLDSRCCTCVADEYLAVDRDVAALAELWELSEGRVPQHWDWWKHLLYSFRTCRAAKRLEQTEHIDIEFDTSPSLQGEVQIPNLYLLAASRQRFKCQTYKN